jgi:hypothetical protein
VDKPLTHERHELLIPGIVRAVMKGDTSAVGSIKLRCEEKAAVTSLFKGKSKDKTEETVVCVIGGVGVN